MADLDPRVHAALLLHKPDETGDCAECSKGEDIFDWPCNTAIALGVDYHALTSARRSDLLTGWYRAFGYDADVAATAAALELAGERG